jgi:hypothetical protein
MQSGLLTCNCFSCSALRSALTLSSLYRRALVFTVISSSAKAFKVGSGCSNKPPLDKDRLGAEELFAPPPSFTGDIVRMAWMRS